MSDDAQITEAYLFRCDEDRLFAVTVDASGSNLPSGTNTGSWRAMYDLTVEESEEPKDDTPELIRLGLHRYGYFIWREGIEQIFQ